MGSNPIAPAWRFMIKEFIDFILSIETPATGEYVQAMIGIICVGVFFVLFINVVNYGCTLLLALLTKRLGV